MNRRERDELRRRKTNANAFALEALAAFGRFRTGLPREMPYEARREKLKEWTKNVSTLVTEQIEELEAYGRDDIQYPSPIEDFTINMSNLAFLEIMFVLDDIALIRMLAGSCPKEILVAAAELQDKIIKDAKIPEDPENPNGGTN